MPGRKLRPDRLLRLDIEAKPCRKQPGLTLKDGIGLLRLRLFCQGCNGGMRTKLHKPLHHRHFLGLARTSEQQFLHGGGLVMGDVGA